MSTDRHVFVASLCVVLVGSLWGLYWIPVRALAAAGLGGARGSLVMGGIALVAILPILKASGGFGREVRITGLGAPALGGAAFMLYSVGLVEGHVASVILLFYLTPVWTTLITAIVLRRSVPLLRYAVIVIGLAGLFMVLGGNGGVPVPRGLGDWLGLSAGLAWSVASIGMRLRGRVPPVADTAVFIAGAFASGLLLWWLLPITPSGAAIRLDAASVGWAVASALVWWIASMLALVWATVRLEPARVGILLMSEVLVGLLSAALLAGEALTTEQAIGAILLVGAGFMDALAG